MTDFLKGGYSDLLDRDEVGKVRTPKYQLPDREFRYGKKMAKDAEDAGDGLNFFFTITYPFP